ncbi:MAG: beta-lactamase family protein [Bryobacter sp.]|jgi:CubicO group peptidase (beta-lactamase class C family)|nr:beta-lactamase family protein [Bryobacter sp. CoA8 C33]
MRWLLLLALPLCAQTGLDPARLSQIPVRMKSFVDKGTMAGTVTLVARNGKVVALDAAGYTDIESRQPLRTDAIFQIHSMTKPVVAIAAMMLAEEGKLSLNDPVEKHLPEFRGQKLLDGATLRPPARPITIRDLMTHTSGLPTNPPAGIGELHGALHKSLADVVLIISQTPIAFEPGSRWLYSNTGIATLARIVEVHGGMPFEKFLESRIFLPLGMKDTYIYPPKDKWQRMPTAYILKDGKPLKYTADPLGEGAMKFRENARYPLPEGGLYSTANDLFRLYQMMLNGGQLDGQRILSRHSVATMTRVHTGSLSTNGPGMGYGLAWAVARDAAAAPLSEGAYGHGGRYGTYALIDPRYNLIGVFLIHREGGSEERNAFLNIVYGALTD